MSEKEKRENAKTAEVQQVEDASAIKISAKTISQAKVPTNCADVYLATLVRGTKSQFA